MAIPHRSRPRDPGSWKGKISRTEGVLLRETGIETVQGQHSIAPSGHRVLLEGDNETSFELTVRGWGKTNPADRPHRGDAWVDLSIRVNCSTGDWGDEGELLMADEATALANWFEAIASSRQYDRRIDFAEPDFRFELLQETDERVSLRVYFEHRGRPPWARKGAAEDRDIWIDLYLNRQDLHEAAASLRSELATTEAG